MNLTPDNRLSQIFQEVGVAHQFNFYNKNEPPRTLQHPLEEKPIVYNLLGYLEEDNSVILTHDDWHDYLKSVHKGESMDGELREALRNAHQYCFLGLPYHKWYMQLLLRVLSMHVKEMSYERIALERELAQPQRQFYEEQFDMQFIESNFIEFVDELYLRCEQKNMLRSLEATAAGDKPIAIHNVEDVFKEIGQGDTGRALEMLMGYVEIRKDQDLDLYAQTLLLKGRFAKWQKDSAANRMTQENKNIEFAQINFSLVQLTTEAKKLSTP